MSNCITFEFFFNKMEFIINFSIKAFILSNEMLLFNYNVQAKKIFEFRKSTKRSRPETFAVLL